MLYDGIMPLPWSSEAHSSHRVCEKTGLGLTAGPTSPLRIARQSFGPLNPLTREPGSDRGAWSRYDVLGRTVYACADDLTAYLELLAPYRTMIDAERRALQPVADFLARPLEEVWCDVVTDWDESGTMKASWLPRAFREGRAVYELSFPTGWWIDITAAETLAALRERFPQPWPTKHSDLSEPLTLSHLTSDDRFLTTTIAQTLHDTVELDDGSLPLGIQFLSKHGHPSGGTGHCWAYWMRDVDDAGLPERARVLSSRPIAEDDPVFLAAQKLCKIRSR